MADEVQSSIEKFMNNTTGMIPSVDSSAQAKEIDIKSESQFRELLNQANSEKTVEE